MPFHIFLSHNHKDKPLVEPVALRLADIFGQENVFYDSWSIRPGDGIIDQMNSGLEAPEYVFFFVSASSLSSAMVRLEWQNALYAASKGKTRIIPIRVDGSAMPPLLMQTLFIDMHTVGLEASIVQIVNVAQGNASFTPQHSGFSNLTYTVKHQSDGSIVITIRASHLMEPNPNFAVVYSNTVSEVSFEVGDGPYIGGSGVRELADGTKLNAQAIRPMSANLTPDFPLTITLKKNAEADIGFIDLLHEVSQNKWTHVPSAS
jgi:hypothetical protein